MHGHISTHIIDYELGTEQMAVFQCPWEVDLTLKHSVALYNAPNVFDVVLFEG